MFLDPAQVEKRYRLWKAAVFWAAVKDAKEEGIPRRIRQEEEIHSASVHPPDHGASESHTGRERPVRGSRSAAIVGMGSGAGKPATLHEEMTGGVLFAPTKRALASVNPQR